MASKKPKDRARKPDVQRDLDLRIMAAAIAYMRARRGKTIVRGDVQRAEAECNGRLTIKQKSK